MEVVIGLVSLGLAYLAGAYGYVPQGVPCPYQAARVDVYLLHDAVKHAAVAWPADRRQVRFDGYRCGDQCSAAPGQAELVQIR